jgi:HK97 family phage portal protein
MGLMQLFSKQKVSRYAGTNSADSLAIKNSTLYQTASELNGTDLFNLPLNPTGITVTDTTAMRCAAVYACVEKIAVIASLPKHIYKETVNGRERVNHPFWELLNIEPQKSWTAASMWERTIASMLLRGDGIIEIIRGGRVRSKVIGLRPLIRENVYITQVDGELAYRITDQKGATRVLTQADVLHFPGFGFNGYHGMSVIQYAARVGVGISLSADQYSAEFFANGQRPDFLLTTEGTLNAGQIAQTKQSLEERHQGIGNRFKPLILQGGLKMQPITMSSADSQLLETRKYQVVDICTAFGVPPQLIGAQDSTAGWAGSSLEQLNLGFTKYALRPHIARMTQEINRKLFNNSDKFCEFNLDSFLEGDSKTQAEYFAKAVGGPGSQGWMSVNEVRKLKNLLPDSNSDYDTVIKSGMSQPAPAN